MHPENEEIEITDTIREDIVEVLNILQENELTTDGVSEFFENYLVLKGDNLIIGVCGLEIYESLGLLRSMAIRTEWHHQGLGSILLEAMIEKATTRNLDAIYLLTNTAEGFYLKFGFETISRDLAPEAIQHSREFEHLCPVSSKFMKKSLV
jgi:amino-acid N-acetyltransferase